MKINPVLSAVAVIVGLLVFYAFFMACDHIWFPIGGGVMAIVTLVAALGVSFPEQPRSSAVQKVASLAWFFVLLVLGIVLAVLGASVHTYVIACGIGLVAWILTAYFIVKSDQ